MPRPLSVTAISMWPESPGDTRTAILPGFWSSAEIAFESRFSSAHSISSALSSTGGTCS